MDKWRMKKPEIKLMARLLDKFLNLFLCLVALLALWILLQVTSFSSFKVPSDSMYPALLPGDRVWVNKWVMGGRLFNVWEALDGKKVHIWRLPGLGKLKRNDVLVFNYPGTSRKDSIGMDVLRYYVKRCVALPGDTFEIQNAHYVVRGFEQSLGNQEAQQELAHLFQEGEFRVPDKVFNAYPKQKEIGWTIRNFGPFYIPRKGDSLPMTRQHALLYRRVIEWEQEGKLTLRGDSVMLNDRVISAYCFRENYYFMAGDKVKDSRDSRYWGLLPESFIVGKATRIWRSVDPADHRIRWERMWKAVE